MKTKVFLILLLLLPIIAVSQDPYYGGYKAGVDVRPPVFTGFEMKAMNIEPTQTINEFLFEHVEYPIDVIKCHYEGIEVVRFVIDESGSLKDFTVINSVCPSVDEEIIRVLKETDGMWMPGSNNGTPVEMEKEVSLAFLSFEVKDPQKYLLKNARRFGSKANVQFYTKNNYKKALRNYNKSLKYMPNETSSLLSRGLCRYELGDKEGARKDWERINEIGGIDASSYIENLVDMKGYDEMVSILSE